jgi:GNAT superfamily N-acetyltransferase
LDHAVIEPHPVESNLWAMHRDFARNPTTVVHDDQDLLWFSTPGSNAWLNGASWCALGADADARIATVGRAAGRVGTRAQWTTSPSCQPQDLERRLETAGWQPEPEPAMAVAVDARFPAPPTELVVQQVTSVLEVREWTDLFDVSFEIEPRGDQHPWLEPWRHLALGAGSPCRLFLGRVDGLPVSCSMAFLHQGSVGLYGIGTPPHHRGKGYGSALTVAGISWGASRGATTAVLQASAQGEPVYRSLGFSVVFDMTAWSLAPSDRRG